MDDSHLELLERVYDGEDIDYNDNARALRRLDRVELLFVMTMKVRQTENGLEHLNLSELTQDDFEYLIDDLDEVIESVYLTNDGFSLVNQNKQHKRNIREDRANLLLTFGYALIILLSAIITGIQGLDNALLGHSIRAWTIFLISFAIVVFVLVTYHLIQLLTSDV